MVDTFYEENHEDYFNRTVHIDPTPFLTPLLVSLPPGARILDVGCGSGRDLLWFAERGFEVLGLERSPGLARLARLHAHCPVFEADFDTFDFSTLHCDGVMLVGALVHVEREMLPQTLTSIARCLRPAGRMLFTMKEGRGVRLFHDGRCFILWQRKALEAIFHQCGLDIISFDRKVSRLRRDDVWLGYVLQRAYAQSA